MLGAWLQSSGPSCSPHASCWSQVPAGLVMRNGGSWQPIPNITQTIEHSRKQAKMRCWERDRGPARQTVGLHSPTSPNTELIRVLLIYSGKAPSIHFWRDQHPKEAQFPMLLLLPALLTLGNPHLMQSKPSTISVRGHTALSSNPPHVPNHSQSKSHLSSGGTPGTLWG